MAAPSVSAVKRKAVDNKWHVQALVTPSTTYLTATPSETISFASLGLKRVDAIYQPSHDILDPSVALTAAATKRGFSVTLDTPTATHVNLRYWETGGTEVADAVDKSTSTYFLVFVGT